MTRREFQDLFLRALERAAENAENAIRRPVLREFMIQLHAPGHSGSLVTPDEALDAIYLGSDRSFRIIDVAVTEVSSTRTLIFMRVSGHEPTDLTKTWDPKDLGPFKQITSKTIRYGSEDIETHRST